MKDYVLPGLFMTAAALSGFAAGMSTGQSTGAARESARIQATCDDTDAHTFFGKQEYVCMTLEKATQDLKEIYTQGLRDGRRLAMKETAL